MKTLTGNIRYREQKRFRKQSVLVLQVEENSKGVHHDLDVSGRGCNRPYDQTYWRDATVEDLNL